MRALIAEPDRSDAFDEPQIGGWPASRTLLILQRLYRFGELAHEVTTWR
jgi:hypothetical protein